MTVLLALGVVLAAAVLPRRLLLAGLPFLVLLAVSGLDPGIPPVGGVDIHLYDMLLVVLGLRTVSVVLLRAHVRLAPLYAAALLFLVALLVAALVGLGRFGADHFGVTMRPLVRFTAEAALIVIAAEGLETERDLATLDRGLAAFGAFLAANVYFNVLMAPLGLSLGEVQGLEVGLVRSFGLVGDQAGFLLCLFVFRGMFGKDWLTAAVFAGAVLLTGTVGALPVLAVGSLLIWFHGRRADGRPRARRSLVPVAVGGVIVLAAAVAGPLVERFATGGSLWFSGVQRLATADLALEVFADHPLFGVGFLGFGRLAAEYGAAAQFASLGSVSESYTATAGYQLLQTSTDAGILGLALLIPLLLLAMHCLRRGREATNGPFGRTLAAARVWVLSLAVANLTAVWLLPGNATTIVLWLLLGGAVAAQAPRVRAARGGRGDTFALEGTS